MASVFEEAVKIIEERLGRALSPQEITDLQTVLASGATLEDLRAEPINDKQDGRALFPEFGVSERPLVGQQPSQEAQPTPQPSGPNAEPTTVQQGTTQMFNANAAVSGTPSVAFDPFGLGDFGESTFIAGEQQQSRVSQPAPSGIPQQPAGQQAGTIAGAPLEPTATSVDVQVSQFYNEVVGWSEDRIRNLQRSLVRAGYLSPDNFRPGFADDSTLGAIRSGILAAQQRDQDLPTTLREAAFTFKRQKARAERLSARAEATAFKDMAEDRYKQQLLSVYMTNWGINPPPKYIDSIAASGMNIYEFNAHERAKPAFSRSPRYQEERLSLEQQAAGFFGAI